MSAGDFYIVSLKHEAAEVLRFWAPEALGYVNTVEKAGLFTWATIAGEAWRYNDGVSAVAVPCALVEAVAVPGRKVKNVYIRRDVGEEHVVRARELASLVRAAARVAAFRAPDAATPVRGRVELVGPVRNISGPPEPGDFVLPRLPRDAEELRAMTADAPEGARIVFVRPAPPTSAETVTEPPRAGGTPS